jgi:branched-subunit amino acid aminotransferase/4-amino-4-deoxychorismate lyase
MEEAEFEFEWDLVKENEEKEKEIDGGVGLADWLVSKPRGAYTVFAGNRCDLEFQVERLMKSFAILSGGDELDRGKLEKILKLSIGRNKDLDKVVFVVLIPVFEQFKRVLLLTKKLAVKAGQDVIVEIWKDSIPWRNNPNAKDSDWVNQRKKYESLKSFDCSEILLHDGAYQVSEGLVCNIFGFNRNGEMYSSPEEIILEGYALHEIKKKAEVSGVKIVKEPLDLRKENLSNWDALYLCSNFLIASFPVH